VTPDTRAGLGGCVLGFILGVVTMGAFVIIASHLSLGWR